MGIYIDFDLSILLFGFYLFTFNSMKIKLSTAAKEHITPIKSTNDLTQFILLHSEDKILSVSASGVGSAIIKSVLGWK